MVAIDNRRANNVAENEQEVKKIMQILGRVDQRMKYATGLKKVPVKNDCKPSLEFEDPGNNRAGVVPEQFKVSRNMVNSRWNNGVMNMVFSLRGMHDDQTKEVHQCGRTWSAYHSQKYNVRDGYSWDEVKTVIHPGLAGLSESIIDKHVFNALTNVARMFSQGRMEDLSQSARTALQVLPENPIRPFRFFVRMAVMYVSAIIAESLGTNLSVLSSEGAERAPFAIGKIPELSQVLSEGLHNGTNYLYVENVSQIDQQTNMMKILKLVVSKDTKFILQDNRAAPQISNFWPDVGRARLILQGALPREDTVEMLHSGDIFMIMQYLARQLNVVDQMWEAVDMVSTMALRPSGSIGWSERVEMNIALPPLDTRSLALGPCLSSMRNWSSNTSLQTQPEHADLMWNGVCRAMMQQLTYNNIWYELRGNMVKYTQADKQVMYSLQKMFSSNRDVVPACRLAEQLGEKYGWKNLFGRSMLTQTHGKHGTIRFNDMDIMFDRAIQWSEALPFVDQLPAQSSTLAVLNHMSTKHDLGLDMWYSVGVVQTKYSPHDAMNSVVYATNNGVQTGLCTFDQVNQQYYYQSVDSHLAYNSWPRDFQYDFIKVNEQYYSEPVFKTNDINQIIKLQFSHKQRQKYEWYIDWEIAVSDESLMALLSDSQRSEAQQQSQFSQQESVRMSWADIVDSEIPQLGTGVPPQHFETVDTFTPMVKLEQTMGDAAPNWAKKLMNAPRSLYDNASVEEFTKALQTARGDFQKESPIDNLRQMPIEKRALAAEQLSDLANIGVSNPLSRLFAKDYVSIKNIYVGLAAALKDCPAITIAELEQEIGERAPSQLDQNQVNKRLTTGQSGKELFRLKGQEAVEQIQIKLGERIQQIQDEAEKTSVQIDVQEGKVTLGVRASEHPDQQSLPIQTTQGQQTEVKPQLFAGAEQSSTGPTRVEFSGAD